MKIDREKTLSVCENILILLFIFTVCFSNIFSKAFGNLDEIWIYNMSRNIADGLLPYRDFNTITTPLLYMIAGIFLKILGNQLIVMRILASIMMSAIFFMSYLILKKITNKDLALVGLIVVLISFKNVMCIDYNYAVLLMTLILTYIEISKNENDLLKHNFKYDFIIGIIAGISILFKQTTGLAVSIACIGYKIFVVRNKEQLKSFLKIASTRLCGVLVPIIFFAAYLAFNGITKEFLDYAVFGVITNFSNKISYLSLIETKPILSCLVPITLLIMFVLLFFRKTRNEIRILFAYAISSFIVVFPISDEIHFLIGALVTFISCIYIIYLIYQFIINKLKNKAQYYLKLSIFAITSFITIFFTLSIFFNSMIGCYRNYFAVEKEKELKHFVGIEIPDEIRNRIIEVDDFIVTESLVNNNVYVLDAEAAIYNIPLDKYTKDYDMFMIGNFGTKGEDGIIKRIKNESNAIYLLKKSGINWQNPNKVRNYIINNLRLIGESSIFWVYQK